MKPSCGARALTCAAVTDDDDDADGLADGTIEKLALFTAGATDGVELADTAVGVLALLLFGACDDGAGAGDGLVCGAG